MKQQRMGICTNVNNGYSLADKQDKIPITSPDMLCPECGLDSISEIPISNVFALLNKAGLATLLVLIIGAGGWYIWPFTPSDEEEHRMTQESTLDEQSKDIQTRIREIQTQFGEMSLHVLTPKLEEVQQRIKVIQEQIGERPEIDHQGQKPCAKGSRYLLGEDYKTWRDNIVGEPICESSTLDTVGFRLVLPEKNNGKNSYDDSLLLITIIYRLSGKEFFEKTFKVSKTLKVSHELFL